MTEILFYHLSQSTLEDALPPLLEKSLERGWTCVVQCGGADKMNALNTHLWTYKDESFLAHGLEDDHATEHPIVLTQTQANPNKAAIRFLVDGAEPPDLGNYTRAVMMFDGYNNEEVAAARTHWKSFKSAGHTVTYWQQEENRRWTKKA